MSTGKSRHTDGQLIFNIFEISSEELILINNSLHFTLRWNQNPRVREVIRELIISLSPQVEEAYDDLCIYDDDDDVSSSDSDDDDYPF